MAETHLNLTISLLLCIFFLATSTAAKPKPQNPAIRDAIKALSDSGFSSMSTQLQRISKSLKHVSKTSPLTIFAPTDSVFRQSTQPAHSIYYHLCPLKIPVRRLPTLPFGTKIPTFFTPSPLIATSPPPDPDIPHQILLNGVPVNGTAVFDSGPVVIYAVNQFFDPFFKPVPIPTTPPSPLCRSPTHLDEMFELAAALYSTAMGDFLAWQLADPHDQPELTVFAPVEESLPELQDYRDFRSFFRRHVVPCRLSSDDLWLHVATGIPLPTFLEGYTINVTKSNGNLVFNGVPMVHGDVHNTLFVATHGIAGRLELKPDDPFPEEHRSILAQHRMLAEHNLDGADGLVGLVRNPWDGAASRIQKFPNGSSIIAEYPVYVNPMEVSTLILRGSVLNTYTPFSFSRNQSQMKVHFNCETQSADFRLPKDALKAIGDSYMSAYFDVQLTEPGRHNPLTVLAPMEDIEKPHHYTYYIHSRQQLIPCRLTWSDLVSAEEGKMFPTLDPEQDGYWVEVTKVDNTLLLNNVPVIYPDLYTSETLVVHGIKSSFEDGAATLVAFLNSNVTDTLQL